MKNLAYRILITKKTIEIYIKHEINVFNIQICVKYSVSMNTNRIEK